MAVTIKDIAKMAGVSISTVSRALNDSYDVGAATRMRIMKLAAEHGYSPNGVARGLVMQKSFTIGLIIPDISNPFFAEIVGGVERRARELGYSVVLCNSGNDVLIEKQSIAMLRSKMVDGLIVAFSQENSEELQNMEADNFPLVQLDRSIPGSKTAAVLVDNRLSAYQATKYLLECGHRRIAHFAGSMATQSGRDRRDGFLQAIEEYRADLAVGSVFCGGYSLAAGVSQFEELLKQDIRPTAIFAASDLQAVGALHAAALAGVLIPEEISVIGHDDIPVASMVRPQLTTMSQPKYKLGEVAVDLLLRKMCGNEAPQADVVMRAELLERDSVIKIL